MIPTCIAACFAAIMCIDNPHEPTPDWPSFRGANASGTAGSASTATTWNVETGENIRFSTPIPGLAHSSPVIAGDRLFVTTAVRADGDAEPKVGLYGNVQSVADEGVHQFVRQRVQHLRPVQRDDAHVPVGLRFDRIAHDVVNSAHDGDNCKE